MVAPPDRFDSARRSPNARDMFGTPERGENGAFVRDTLAEIVQSAGDCPAHLRHSCHLDRQPAKKMPRDRMPASMPINTDSRYVGCAWITPDTPVVAGEWGT